MIVFKAKILWLLESVFKNLQIKYHKENTKIYSGLINHIKVYLIVCVICVLCIGEDSSRILFVWTQIVLLIIYKLIINRIIYSFCIYLQTWNSCSTFKRRLSANLTKVKLMKIVDCCVHKDQRNQGKRDVIFVLLYLTNITDPWFPKQRDVTLPNCSLGQLSKITSFAARFSWKNNTDGKIMHNNFFDQFFI